MGLRKAFFGSKEKATDEQKEAAPSEVKPAKKEEVKKPDFEMLKNKPSALQVTHIHALGQYYLDLYPTKSLSHSMQEIANECVAYDNAKGSALSRWRWLVDEYAKVINSRNFAPLFVDLFQTAFGMKKEDFIDNNKQVISNVKIAILEHFLMKALQLAHQKAQDPNKMFSPLADGVADGKDAQVVENQGPKNK